MLLVLIAAVAESVLAGWYLRTEDTEEFATIKREEAA
jgi:hypothetical protein